MSFAELEVLVNGLRRSEESALNGEVVKEYFVGEQSYECLKELQRFLRREKLSDTKDVLKQLGSWNIVKNQLLPLMISLQFDNQEEDIDIYGMSYEICKLLVMLTMPPESKSYDIQLQINYLQDFKEAFLVYPNNEGISSFVHLLLTEPLSREGRARTEEDERLIELILSLFKNLLLIPDRVLQSGASASFHKTQLQDDLFAAFKKADVFDLLMMMSNNLIPKGTTKVFDFEDDEEEEEEKEEDEEKDEEEREEEKDEDKIENDNQEEKEDEEKAVAANEEEAASKPVTAPNTNDDEPMDTESKEDEEKGEFNKDGEGEVVEEVVEESHVLHRQIANEITNVEKVKKRETGFKKWSMLLLELCTLILKRERPEHLVQTFFKYHSLSNKKPATPDESLAARNPSPEKYKPALGRTPLSALLTAEHTSMWKTNRSPVQTVVAKRGTYIIQEGSHVIVKKSLTETTTAHSVNAALNAPPIKRNARHQKAIDNMNSNSAPSVGITGDQAQLLLREFVQNFLDRGCYNSLMDCAKQQLKDPSSQTSHMLADQVNFILLVKFFTGYVYCDYVMRKQLRGAQQSTDEIDITQLRSTIHSSDFREILSFCALYFDEKNWSSLTVAVSALKNMFNVMKALTGCPSDSAQLIAKKLHHQVFYYDTTLESIINIMKSFDSSKHTLSYLREIVELLHVVNTLVAHNGPVIVQHKKKRINTNRRKKKKASGSLIDDEAQKDEEGGSKEGEQKDDAMAVEKEQSSETPEGITANSQENSEDVRAVKDFIENLDAEQQKKEKAAMKEIESKQQEAEKNQPEEEEEEDDEDEEDREVFLEKVVNMEEYYSKFAHPTIIQNYSLLLKHYKQNPPALNHFLVSFLNRVCTHTPFEPMLYQLSIINILNEILNDKSIATSQAHEELVSFAARVARNFLQVLKEEENLSVLVFAWKRKQDCYYLHPKGSSFHEKYQRTETKKKEKSKEKKAKKEKKKVTIRVDVDWNEEEDKMLRELYEKHKNSDICFDLMYPHFTDPNKRSIQVIFDRLKQLNIISADHPRPQELDESEEEAEAESSEDEEEELVIRLDDDEDKQEITAIPDNVDQELVDLVYKVLLKNYISVLDLLKKEIDTTIDHREGINPENPAELEDVNDHLIIPLLEAETEQLNHETVISLLNYLGLSNINNNIRSWWRIPKTMMSDQLRSLREKLDSAEGYAKQKIQKQNELRKKLLDVKGKPVKKQRKPRQKVTEEKEREKLPKEIKKKDVPKEKEPSKKAAKPVVVERSEPKKQKKNKNEEKKILDDKRKEALETMKQRLSDIKKRKRERRISTEPDDLESISQEAQLTSPKTGRLNRKTVQDEELDLGLEDEEFPLERKAKKAKVTNLQQAVDLDDLFQESEVVDDYADIPVEDDMMDQDKENSPVNIPINNNNQMVKKVGSVVLDEEDSSPIKVASKKKKLMIVNDDE